jgi:hypothetical protein
MVVFYGSIYKKNTENRQREKDTANGIFGKRKTAKRYKNNVETTLQDCICLKKNKRTSLWKTNKTKTENTLRNFLTPSFQFLYFSV